MPRAKKAPAKSKAKSKGVINYAEELEKYAAAEAQREESGEGEYIGIKDSKFSFQGNELGSEINVIVLDYSFVNSYYDRPYDPDNTTPPACFAAAKESSELIPTDQSPNPQGDEETGACQGCWANDFESDARGRGKACKNTRRLAVISADGDLAEMLADPQVAFVNVPPTSLKAWRGYVNQLAKAAKKPPFAFITQLSFDEDAEWEKLEFTKVEDVDIDHMPALIELRQQVQEPLLQVPDFSDYVPYEPPKRGKAAAKKSGAAKRGGKKFS